MSQQLSLVKPAQPQGLALVTIDSVVLTALRALCLDSNGQPATDNEIRVYAQYCAKKGLDPFSKQVYFIKDNKGRVSYQISIDGLWGRADATGKLKGILGPFWMGRDREWTDFWVEEYAPLACKVGLLKEGFNEVCWGFARFASFAGATDAWKPWGKMPEHMISKCAKAVALRTAFPEPCGNLYIPEEMASGSVGFVEGEIMDEEPNAPASDSRPTGDRKEYRQINVSEPEPVAEKKTRAPRKPKEEPSPNEPQSPAPQTAAQGASDSGPPPASATEQDAPGVAPAAEPDWAVDPLDGAQASIEQINLAWAAWRKVYGTPAEGQTEAEGKANATKKLEILLPQIRSMRNATNGDLKALYAHLNEALEPGKDIAF